MAGKKQKNKQTLEKFYDAVKNSIVLSEEQKDFWLKNGDKLPPMALGCITHEISQASDDVSKCLRAAIENDPKNKHLNKLKTEVIKIKKKALEIEETSQDQNPEEFLKKNLG